MLHYLGVVLCGFALGTCLALAHLCRELIHPIADVNKLGICFCQGCVAGARNVSVLARLITCRDYTVALTHKLAEAGLELLLKLMRVSLIARDLNLLLLQKSMLLEKPELITLALGGAAIELSLEH